MMILLNGRRFRRDQVRELLAECGWGELAAHMDADGFVLRPIRAPRRLVNNRLNLRLTWVRQVGETVETVRLSATI